jgi:hypothetical protein
MPGWLWYGLKLFIGIGFVALAYLSAGLVVRWARGPDHVPGRSGLVPPFVALIGLALVAVLVFPPSINKGQRDDVDTLAVHMSSNLDPIYPVRRVPLPVTLLVVGLIFTGGLVMTRFEGAPRRLGPFVSAGALALLAVEEMTLVRFEVNPNFVLSITKGAPFDLRPAGRVGPFLEATANKLSPYRGDSALTAVIDTLRAHLRSNELQFVIVLGGVDKRQLRDPAQTWFGSNEGLAQARAAWLSDTLAKAINGLDAVPVLVWSQGARNFGTSVTSLHLQEDRRVTVVMGLRRPVPR